MYKHLFYTVITLSILTSCEEVINVDLNTAKPAFVAEAIICKDSVCIVRLTRTASYFSQGGYDFIEDGAVRINDGITLEELQYKGEGYYEGGIIKGVPGRYYEIEIEYKDVTYTAISFLPVKTEINSVRYTKDNSQTIYNPNGETVITITCEFYDNPEVNNFYMIQFLSDGRLIEQRYFMLTESGANGGSFNNTNNLISFSESIFYDGDEAEVKLFSIDKFVYNYFMQLDDVLFWKRRAMPPTPYNPVSNINNGALGYFAAWGIDTRKFLLE